MVITNTGVKQLASSDDCHSKSKNSVSLLVNTQAASDSKESLSSAAGQMLITLAALDCVLKVDSGETQQHKTDWQPSWKVGLKRCLARGLVWKEFAEMMGEPTHSRSPCIILSCFVFSTVTVLT